MSKENYIIITAKDSGIAYKEALEYFNLRPPYVTYEVIKYTRKETTIKAWSMTDEEVKELQEEIKAETKEILANRPKPIVITCPYCKSTNTKKISGISKAGSVALWGIFAAGKVSKQWHCNNCGSDF